MGEILIHEGKTKDAVEILKKVYARTRSVILLHRLEELFLDQGEPSEIIRVYQEALQQDPQNPVLQFYLGKLYYRLEMLDESARTLASIGERIKSSPTFHYLLGRIHERKGDLGRAIDAYVSCLQQLELGTAEYVCRVCRERYPDWRDFCARCGSWNSVELDFEEEHLSAEELGVREVPVWGAAEDSGEFPAIPIPAEPEG